MINFLRGVVFATCFFALICSAEITPIYRINEAQSTYLQVPLSHDIYRYSQHADLRDLVVVDASNNNLPYRLVSLKPNIQEPETQAIAGQKTNTVQKSETVLDFYPITANATPAAMRALRTTNISVVDNDVHVAISDKPMPASIQPTNSTPDFYLIDISTLKTNVTALQIEWLPNEKNQYLEVQLEASSNLQNWVSLGRSTLLQIIQQEQQLKRNRLAVDIAPNAYEFLRLKIIQGGDALQLVRITALQLVNEIKPAEVASESWSVSGSLASVQTTVYFPNEHSKTYPVAAWEYVRDESTPAETLSLNLAENTYGDSVIVFARASEKQKWQLQHQGIWFNAQVGSQWQQSDAIKLYRNSDKFWRIELKESTKTISKPELVFSWQPAQLQIITNNKPLYSLAINPQNTAYQSNQVFNQLLGKTNPVWVTSELVSLHASALAVTLSSSTMDWQKYLFWAFLLLALIVLLGFALRLFKQVNKNLS